MLVYLFIFFFWNLSLTNRPQRGVHATYRGNKVILWIEIKKKKKTGLTSYLLAYIAIQFVKTDWSPTFEWQHLWYFREEKKEI